MEVRRAQWRLAEIEHELAERLAQLPWYVDLMAEKRAVQERKKDHAPWIAYRRCHVGRASDFYFEIKAEGDTWQEAIDEAKAKRGA